MVTRKGTEYLYVPRASGGSVLRTTGTSSKHVVRGMKRMIAQLKDDRRWKLLNEPLGKLYDAYVANALDAYERALEAELLKPHVDAYLLTCKSRGLAPRNIENIERQLRSFQAFAPTGTTADLSSAVVTGWLTTLETSSGTRRQFLYAVTGFTRYLLDVGVLKDYPLSRVKAPKKNAPRMTYHDAATDERIVQAASPQYRALFAFVKGTGCDLSTALAMRKDDINLAAATARMRGTKTAKRDVHEGLIEAWAIPYLRALIVPLIGNPLIWHDQTRHGAARHHQRCCTAIGVTGYTLKDSRHSIAVRMAKAGYSLHKIAEQLGNSVQLVASVYSVHIPEMTPRMTPEVTRTLNEKTGNA